MAAADQQPFRPALIVVDFQQDFCPPNGAIPVPNARLIAPVVNHLLDLPFPVRLATRDWHPPNHVSFATNHPSSSSSSSSTTTISHPSDPSRSYTTQLWPVHCLRDSPGARLVPELHAQRLQAVLDKGTHPDFEMYSAFYDPFRLCDSGLADMLTRERVTHVYVVGLAAEFCVRATAEDALAEGFTTYIVQEATMPACPDKWPQCSRDILAKGVNMISVHGDQVARVRMLSNEQENT